MLKKSTTICAFSVSVGIGFILSGMLTSSVIKVCKRMEKISPSFIPKKENTSEDEDQTICLEQGLFVVQLGFPDGIFYLATELESQSVEVRVVAGMLLLGCIGAVLSAFVYTQSACYADSNDMKTVFATVKRIIIATMLQSTNVLLLVIGLTIYTNQKMKAIGNPDEFVAQIAHAVSGIQQNFIQDTQSSPFVPATPPIQRFPYPLARALSTANVQNSISNGFPTFSNTNNPGNFQTILEQMKENKNSSIELVHPPTHLQPLGLFNLLIAQNMSLPGRRQRATQNLGILRPRPRPRRPDSLVREIIFQDIENAVPILGYSFYLLWTGFTFHFFALLVGIRTWRHTLRKQVRSPTSINTV